MRWGRSLRDVGRRLIEVEVAVAGGLDARDSSAALGFVAAMHDLPNVTPKGGTLYVFSLR